ncbi:hypothetical protein C8F01DRAFT_1242040 [Mycena amicta]|nr:hypothetical protein C8F01DRAFT_1242040 [Mycena amicta]
MKATFLQFLALCAAGVAFGQTTSKSASSSKATSAATSSTTRVTSTTASATGTSSSVGTAPTGLAFVHELTGKTTHVLLGAVEDPNPNESFAAVVSQWAAENEWTGKAGSGNLPVLLVPSAVTNTANAAAPVEVHLGCGYFEVETTYSQGDTILKNCSVNIIVPIWGRAQLLAPQDVPLNLTSGIPVEIPGVVNGTIGFFLSGSEVLMKWVLDTPFAGTLDEDGLSVFPTGINSYFTASQLKTARIFTAQELAELAGPRPAFSIPALRDATDEEKLLKQFLNDFVVDSANGTVAVQTFAASQYSIDVSFLSIFTVTGSVDPSSFSAAVTLYVNIPLAGRVSLTKIQGSLLTGITANINVVLASGNAVLSATPNGSGKHDLYIEAVLSITFVGDFKTPGRFKILTLP